MTLSQYRKELKKAWVPHKQWKSHTIPDQICDSYYKDGYSIEDAVNHFAEPCDESFACMGVNNFSNSIPDA
jgi:hypothetical protein